MRDERRSWSLLEHVDPDGLQLRVLIVGVDALVVAAEARLAEPAEWVDMS
jgi:hypothetical protein